MFQTQMRETIKIFLSEKYCYQGFLSVVVAFCFFFFQTTHSLYWFSELTSLIVE